MSIGGVLEFKKKNQESKIVNQLLHPLTLDSVVEGCSVNRQNDQL